MSLSKRMGDGRTLREHLQSQQRQTRKTPPELSPVECPEELKYLWGYWVEMDGRRQMTKEGPMAVSHQEMLAWASLHRVVLDPLEVKALDAIETLFLTRKEQ